MKGSAADAAGLFFFAGVTDAHAAPDRAVTLRTIAAFRIFHQLIITQTHLFLRTRRRQPCLVDRRILQ